MNTPQALSLLNGSWVDEATIEFARRFVASSRSSTAALSDSQVQELFRILLARDATRKEVEWVHQSMRELSAHDRIVSEDSERREDPSRMTLAVAEIVRALINSNEFYYVE